MPSQVLDFNPRSPCGERHVDDYLTVFDRLFQSTLPVWGATLPGCGFPPASVISIHAPRVGSDVRRVLCPEHQHSISIHAPRVGSDSTTTVFLWRTRNFNPRSPCGERLGFLFPLLKQFHFNPRSPCGERPAGFFQGANCAELQSTLPVWGATTSKSCQTPGTTKFQSTLPVWGAT